jgi:hypothetical protein
MAETVPSKAKFNAEFYEETQGRSESNGTLANVGARMRVELRTSLRRLRASRPDQQDGENRPAFLPAAHTFASPLQRRGADVAESVPAG